MARIPKLDPQGRFLAPDVLAQLDARTKATLRADLPAAAKELKIGGVDGSVPIFPTLAEAQAWEKANPGKRALTLEPSTPDTVAPTWSASLTVGTPTDKTVVVTASALASDDRAVAGYEVTYNGGTWSSIVPSGREFTLTGAPATSYALTKLRAKDGAGNVSAALSVPAYTMAAAPPAKPGDVLTSESFTTSGAVAGRMTDAALGGSPMAMSGGGTASGGTLTGALTLAGVTQRDYTLRFKIAAVGTAESNIFVRSSAGMNVSLRLSPTLTRALVQGPDGSAFSPSMRAPAVGDTVTFTVKENAGTITLTPPTGTPATSTFSLSGNLGAKAPAFDGAGAWALDDVVVIAE